MRFSKRYATAALVLLIFEVMIGLWVHDGFVRPYLGDVLVVILLYCIVQTFFKLKVWPVVLGVFLLACLVEVGQHYGLVYKLDLHQYGLARIVMGTTFSWSDILAYAVGCMMILLAEYGFLQILWPAHSKSQP